MIVFADYDNIDPLIQSRGIEHIVQRIISAVSILPIVAQPRLNVRFYGGWFFGSNLTKVGQSISTQISGAFPMRITQPWAGESKSVDVIANAQIARGLAACEQLPLHHTYRRRPFKGKLHFHDRNAHLCGSAASCPMATIESFIESQKCPTPGCTVQQHQVLDKSEQKLVDTMLVADLLFWASQPSHPILAVLGSDDDMWPGIRTAAALAPPVIQIHTERSPEHANYVRHLTTKSYLQTQL